jgi:hypothetical protein
VLFVARWPYARVRSARRPWDLLLARGVRGLGAHLGRGLERRVVSGVPKYHAPPCGCAWPPADKRALTSKHARGAPGGVRGERGVALPPVTRDIVEAACREVAEEQPRRFRLSAY